MNTPTITVTEAVARILTAAATYLDENATITHPFGYTETACMTDGWRDTAMWIAVSAVDTIPNAKLRDEARNTARDMLPPVSGTIAQYANQLRTLAA